jgi:hypothetical protein
VNGTVSGEARSQAMRAINHAEHRAFQIPRIAEVIGREGFYLAELWLEDFLAAVVLVVFMAACLYLI